MLWWLLQNAVVALALAAVARLICLFWRLDPVARHALWLIVLIKLVTPPLVAWPWKVPQGAEKMPAPMTAAVAPKVDPAPIAAPRVIDIEPQDVGPTVSVGPYAEPEMTGSGDPMLISGPQTPEKENISIA